MHIGLHVSAAGGAHLAPSRAHELGCDTFQFFSRPPQGGKAPLLTQAIIEQFRNDVARFGIKKTIIHTPYFINLCSENPRIEKGSASIIREELERASTLGVQYVVTHIGAAKNLNRKKALAKVKNGIAYILKGYNGTAMLLLENAAGSGTVIGDTIEELAELLKSTHSKKIGICLDTCHLFASGYDMRSKTVVTKLATAISKTMGKKAIHFIHANDSKSPLGEKKDRHEHIGKGHIGLAGFKVFFSNPSFSHLPVVIETPHDGEHLQDQKKLRSLAL